MDIHPRCKKASKHHAINKPLGPRMRQVLEFVDTHDGYKLSDIRKALWPWLLDHCYRSVEQLESNHHFINPCRIDALANHMMNGYNSGMFAKLVQRGWLAYDTNYRWHLTDLGAAKLVENDLNG